jgi:hypothetical protein
MRSVKKRSSNLELPDDDSVENNAEMNEFCELAWKHTQTDQCFQGSARASWRASGQLAARGCLWQTVAVRGSPWHRGIFTKQIRKT